MSLTDRDLVPSTSPSDDDTRIAAAIALAADLLRAADAASGAADRRVRRRLRRVSGIVGKPAAQDLAIALTDEVMRIDDPRRAARGFRGLVAQTPPDALGRFDRLQLRLGALASAVLPRTVMRLVERRVRADSAGVVLPAEDPALAGHLATRRGEGMRANVNVLGEAILSDAEALERRRLILQQLERSDVDYVSVKLSAISAHVSALSFDDTVAELVETVLPVMEAAAAASPHKFVNFDMEEYRDLALTTAVFRRVLDRPGLSGLSAGIVLQAYLPDSHAVAEELGEWALRRVQSGGAPIKVRIVKGANLAMEQVEAEMRGWEVAPYGSKADVDASYKRMLDTLLRTRFDSAVRVGVASHNVFDLAWALLAMADLADAGRPDRIELEMLEGMAPGQAAAVAERAGGVLLYSPIVRRDDFAAAIAYLVRRLDENTAPDNFLTSLFSIVPGNEVFDDQAQRFAAAALARHTVGTGSRRRQDRTATAPADDVTTPFVNASDTDFTQPSNRRWLNEALDAWQPEPQPLLATADDVERAVAAAKASTWGTVPGPKRAEVVNRIGDAVAARRGSILAVMAHEAGKTIGEGDPELSEAIDFARYYARSVAGLDRLAAEGAPSRPLGAVVVAPPWNFPFAIALGGVTAALAAGNAVILKPAPQARRTARLVAECCWAAGVPSDALQYVPTPDDEAGRRLITHTDVHAVILTGAHDTARMFLDWRPDLRLHAETSGKNAMVITAAADLDLAIRDLVRSAFLHAGQKCSAASLAIVEASVYDDPSFRRRLHDAAVSLRVGSALDLGTDIGPLVEAPGVSLQRALTRLEPGESWLLEPRRLSDTQWSPGIRWGVQPGSWFARTECFGPVLGVVRADDLDHAISIQNDSDYGLTAGLQSLDPSEIHRWIEAVEAGNLYVNRGITGAIVRRQPFGGWKRSVVGPTVKAGGPDYVASLREWPASATRTDAVAWFRVASQGTDPSGLRAESNLLRLRPLAGGVALRVGGDAAAGTEALATAFAAAVGTRMVVSRSADEPDDVFAARLARLGVDRLRLVGCGPEADPVRRAAHEAGVAVDERPVHGHAEVEGPRWCHEQAISRTLHRHGHLRSSHQ